VEWRAVSLSVPVGLAVNAHRGLAWYTFLHICHLHMYTDLYIIFIHMYAHAYKRSAGLCVQIYVCDSEEIRVSLDLPWCSPLQQCCSTSTTHCTTLHRHCRSFENKCLRRGQDSSSPDSVCTRLCLYRSVSRCVFGVASSVMLKEPWRMALYDMEDEDEDADQDESDMDQS